MIEEIKRRLENGEVVELECIDRIGFLKDIDRSETNEKILDQGPLVVVYIDSDGDIRLVGGIGDIYLNVIVSEEFKYFRIKEPSATFNDLIDVAYKAYKDGVFDEISIDKSSFTLVGTSGMHHYFEKDGGIIHCHRGKDLLQSAAIAINEINSLYAETFVIENEEDITKVNIKDDGAKIILANKTELELSGSQDSSNQDGFALGLLLPNGRIVYYGISVLKGATVTQKKI